MILTKYLNKKTELIEGIEKNLQNVKGLNIPVINKDTTNYIMWVFNLYLDEEFGIERDELTKNSKR